MKYWFYLSVGVNVVLVIYCWYLIYRRAENNAKSGEISGNSGFDETVVTDLHIVKNRILGILAHELGGILLAYKDLPKKIDFLVKAERTDELPKLMRHLSMNEVYGEQIISALRSWPNVVKHSHEHINTEIDRLVYQRMQSIISEDDLVNIDEKSNDQRIEKKRRTLHQIAQDLFPKKPNQKE